MINSRYSGKRLAVVVIAGLLVAFAIFMAEKSHKKNTALEAKERKNTLVIVFGSKIFAGDPRIIGGDANSQYIEGLRFLPLIGFDEKGNVENMLASSVQATSENSWLITLKKGIKFADGTEITADDVIATYNKLLNPGKNFPTSPRKSAFDNLKTLEKISKYEIQVTTKEPDASFITNFVIGILPKNAAQNAEPGDISGKGYESGPFLLKEQSDTDWILVKNPNFNLMQQPYLDKIDIKIIMDSGTRYAALIRGDIDLAQNSIDPDKVALIQKEMQNKFNVLVEPRISTAYLAINFRNNTLKNIFVRRAMAAAIDRTSLLKYRLRGLGTLASEMFPPSSFYYSDSIKNITYDPEQAKSYLKQSGLKLPIRFSIKVSSASKETVDLAKTMAANLNQVGFAVTVESLEFSILQRQIRNGIANVWMGTWIGFKDPDHLRFVFSSDMVPPNGGNRGAFSDPILDKLLAEGRKTFDPIKRKNIYDKAQERIADELPYIFLWHSANVVVVSQSVQGYKPYADGHYWSLAHVTKK